jgi:hypothetical protein
MMMKLPMKFLVECCLCGLWQGEGKGNGKFAHCDQQVPHIISFNFELTGDDSVKEFGIWKHAELATETSNLMCEILLRIYTGKESHEILSVQKLT